MIPACRFVATRLGGVAVTQTGGAGPPVLFMHGNSSSSLAFRHPFDAEIGGCLATVTA